MNGGVVAYCSGRQTTSLQLHYVLQLMRRLHSPTVMKGGLLETDGICDILQKTFGHYQTIQMMEIKEIDTVTTSV